MTTGLLWVNRGRKNELMMRRVLKQKDWVDFILNLPIKGEMFGNFQYNSTVSHLLSAIVTKTSNISTQEFAERFLFKAIGISNNIEWMSDPQGINIGGFGLELRPRDLAKFGFLYINQGIWNNTQVIPKDWILESLKNYGEGYGYHVWITYIKNFNGFMATGSGGQIIACFPELDLIIVITSNAQLRRWRNPSYLIDKFINNL